MNSNVALIRALRGPLTLILVGSLFVMEYSGGIGFGKTWPIVIIFIGLLSLAERVAANRQPPLSPNSPGGAQ